MDRRTTPSNGRVAALALAGQVEAERFVTGEPARIGAAVSDLSREPGGRRDRQLLFGAAVLVYERRAGWAFVSSVKDGYVGYIPETDLAQDRGVTHRVSVRATLCFSEADFKSFDRLRLSFGSELAVLNEAKHFFETSDGFVPKAHLRPIERAFRDPVTVAQLFFGAPYLWGGNSDLGLDCSGLVQAGLLACHHPCPADSDQQHAALGRDIAADIEPMRGDIWFWKGHVALVVDPDTILHANAHHMAVAYESLERAPRRIEAQGDGPVIARRRLG